MSTRLSVTFFKINWYIGCFLRLEDDLWHMGSIFYFFQWSCRILFSYSTNISEYCVLWSGFLYLHASSVFLIYLKNVSIYFSILSMFLKSELSFSWWMDLFIRNWLYENIFSWNFIIRAVYFLLLEMLYMYLRGNQTNCCLCFLL